MMAADAYRPREEGRHLQPNGRPFATWCSIALIWQVPLGTSLNRSLRRSSTGVRRNHGDRYMPKFVTIGYGDREGYDRTDARVRDAAHAHDAQLIESGVLMGIAGTPVQVRNPNAGGVETKIGPFMSSSLPIAGFAIIEAAT